MFVVEIHSCEACVLGTISQVALSGALTLHQSVALTFILVDCSILTANFPALNCTVKEGLMLTPSARDTSLAKFPRSEFQLHGKNPKDKCSSGAVHGTVHGEIPGDKSSCGAVHGSPPMVPYTVPYTARNQEFIFKWSCAWQLPSTVPYTTRI